MMLLLAGCHSVDQGSQTNQTPTNNQQQVGSNPSERGGEVITYTSVADIIAIPDKIIYYRQGKQTVIDRDNAKFNKVIERVKTRSSSADDATQSYISNSDIERLKQNDDALEFIYERNIIVEWKPPNSSIKDFTYKFNYNAILFPLTGEYKKYMLFKPRSPGPIGDMGPADDLLKYLNE